MNAYWLEQCECDVPRCEEWLCGEERVRSEMMHIAKRRADWRRGRWTAKLAVASLYGLSVDPKMLAAIEARPASSGAPELHIHGVRSEVAISLSHRGDCALVVLGPAGASIGCDLERIEPRSDAFIQDYFTREERQTIERARDEDRAFVANLIWSAKESALKALGVGLRASTHSVRVTFENRIVASAEPWSGFRVQADRGQSFCGAWSRTGSLVRTVVAAEPVLRLLELTPTGVGKQLSKSGHHQFPSSPVRCDNSRYLERVPYITDIAD